MMTPPSAVTSLILQTSGLQPLPSLQTLKKIISWSNTWYMSFNPDKSHTLMLSLRKDHMANPPIYLLSNPLEEVQSLKLLDFTIGHDLSWANHISKLASKVSH